MYPSTNLQIIDNIIINEVDIDENWASFGVYCDDNSKDVFVLRNSIKGFRSRFKKL